MSTIEQDKILIEGIAREDKKAIEQLYKAHYTMIQSMVLANAGSKDDAADLFQETVIVLFEKLKTGQFELQSLLKTYLYSIARRLWLKKLQQQQRYTHQNEHIEETIPVDDDVEHHQQLQNNFVMMEAAMDKIGEPCKSLLQAYYLQKKHMNVIATEFGYTNADNAKTQKYKCLVRLKKLFFAQYKNNS
ncbi:RNA polymerase sigma factor [Ferruginibacter yonginensis]|uniref:RNA polymerase sigma factor n=1 Tax=Ferruginibacter yonginensis TaxID=1310416 RepID=A0ABV8QNF4_9BACT